MWIFDIVLLASQYYWSAAIQVFVININSNLHLHQIFNEGQISPPAIVM